MRTEILNRRLKLIAMALEGGDAYPPHVLRKLVSGLVAYRRRSRRIDRTDRLASIDYPDT